MPLYEHVFLARQDVSTSQAEALTKEFQGVIEANGGKVTRTEYWGLKPLAFKIKKSRKAHYTMFHIDAPHPAVAEMQRQMGLSTDIIRQLTIKVDAFESEPSPMMRKGDRDDRRGPRDRDGGGFRGDRGDRGDRGGRGPRGDREGGGGFRGDREGGGGFRGDREGGGGFRGDREGGGYRGGRGRSDDQRSTPSSGEENS
ncbi:MAG: 30S ribosomal protein S6 [Hyphomicrobiaceae bacterium]